MTPKQKIGIVCDNYKVRMFREEFEAAGIEIVSAVPNKDLFTVITVFDRQERIKPIVDKVTQYYLDYYKTNN